MHRRPSSAPPRPQQGGDAPRPEPEAQPPRNLALPHFALTPRLAPPRRALPPAPPQARGASERVADRHADELADRGLWWEGGGESAWAADSVEGEVRDRDGREAGWRGSWAGRGGQGRAVWRRSEGEEGGLFCLRAALCRWGCCCRAEGIHGAVRDDGAEVERGERVMDV